MSDKRPRTMFSNNQAEPCVDCPHRAHCKSNNDSCESFSAYTYLIPFTDLPRLPKKLIAARKEQERKALIVRLLKRGPISVQEISDETGVSKMAARRVLDELAAHGKVTRNGCADTDDWEAA